MTDNRTVTIPCFVCDCDLQFHVKNDVVRGDGRIIANIPCAVCPECIAALLRRVPDPPGLICFDNLSAIVSSELLRSDIFVLPKSKAIEFFQVLFPDKSKRLK